MCNEELLKNVKMACDENLPKGVELAWGDVNGNSVRWTDLRAALEVCCGGTCERANGLLVEPEPEPEPEVQAEVDSDEELPF